MQRKLLFLGMTGILVVMVGTAWKIGPTTAQQPGPVARASKPAPQLPITQVVLFSSGVGYFQREGEVEGDARVDLSFQGNDINDLIKSLVLQDMGGGKISTISYDSHDPIDKTLKSFALDLTNNPRSGKSSTRPAAKRSKWSRSRARTPSPAR
jgi:hypothetical protein